jgi:hypothetical protein
MPPRQASPTSSQPLLFGSVLGVGLLRLLFWRCRRLPRFWWFRRRFRCRCDSGAAVRLVAAHGVLGRGVRRRRICPRGNNAFNAAAGGTAGKQRRQNPYCNKAHENEDPCLDAHPNAEKLGPVPASGPPASTPPEAFRNRSYRFSFVFRTRHVRQKLGSSSRTRERRHMESITFAARLCSASEADHEHCACSGAF